MKKSQIKKFGATPTIDGVLAFFETKGNRVKFNDLVEYLEEMHEEEIDIMALDSIIDNNNTPTSEHDWYFETFGEDIVLRNSPYNASTKKSIPVWNKIEKRCPKGYHKNPKTGECESAEGLVLHNDSSGRPSGKEMEFHRRLQNLSNRNKRDGKFHKPIRRSKNAEVTKGHGNYYDAVENFIVDNGEEGPYYNDIFDEFKDALSEDEIMDALEYLINEGTICYNENSERFEICAKGVRKMKKTISEDWGLRGGIINVSAGPGRGSENWDFMDYVMELEEDDDERAVDELYEKIDAGETDFAITRRDGWTYDIRVVKSSKKMRKSDEDDIICPYCGEVARPSRDPAGAYVAYCNHCDRPLEEEEISYGYVASAKKQHVPDMPSFRDMTNKMRNTRTYRIGE